MTEHQIERTVTGETTHVAEAFAPLAAPAPDLYEEPDFVDDEEPGEDEEAIEAEDTDDDATSERAARPPRDGDQPRREEDGNGRRRRRRRGRRDDREPREGAAGEPRPFNGEGAPVAPGADDDDSEEGRRRRRRGRRGGRSGGGREDGRPPEEFQWMRPRVPFGDEPFVWHDVAELEAQTRNGGDRPPRPAPAPAPAATQVAETTDVAPVSSPDGPQDIWVELPATPTDGERRPRRSRGGRGRGRSETREARIEDAAEALIEPAIVEAPVVDTAPEPVAEPAKPARKSRAKKAATVEDAATATVPEAEAPATQTVTTEAEPEAAPAPKTKARAPRKAPAAVVVPLDDPAEILAPPPKPRAGWWRRA